MTREMTRVMDSPSSSQMVRLQGLAALRSLIHYSRQPLEFSVLARDRGDTVRLQLGPVDLYLFNHPRLIEAVLSKQNQHFVKDLRYRALRGAFGNGLLLSEGDLWQRHRRLMQPGFTGDRMALYAEAVVADTGRVLSTWQAGEVRDIHREMSQLTVRVIARAMFGVDAVETALDIVEAMDDALKPGAIVYVSQWALHRDPRFFDAPGQFRPQRWAGDLEQRLPRGVYFPFGAGPRVCIGRAFSMMESVLILAMVVQRFRLTLVPQPPVELLPSITLRPKGSVEMTVSK